MSAVNNTVSAYAAPRQSWAGALWADKARLRRILMFWGVGIFLLAAGAVYLVGGRYISADDAYVHANKLMVSTDVSGLVQSVNVHEGQQVKAGDVLFSLDPQPFQIALENAQANLASTVQDVESTRAGYRSAVAQIAAQQAMATMNAQTYSRYQALAKQNAIAARDTGLKLCVTSGPADDPAAVRDQAAPGDLDARTAAANSGRT